MLTIETIDYRNQVRKVWEEARIEAGYLAAAYSKMLKYVLQQNNKHQLETLRMIQRTIHE